VEGLQFGETFDASKFARTSGAVHDHSALQKHVEKRLAIYGGIGQVLEVELNNAQGLLKGIQAMESAHCDTLEALDVHLDDDR
jgi:hypothetical protein